MSTKVTNGLDLQANWIINLKDAVNPQDAVTYAQLQAAIQGYSWKQPVRAATTANITLSGVQTIDGVSLVAGDRVLVRSQTAGSGNGIYVVAAGAWTRATDMDTGPEALGAATFISEGGTLGNTVWLQTTDGPITIGTTALVFAQIGGGATYTAGNGISINAGVIAVDPTVVARKSSATIGDGTATSITHTHGLGTLDVQVTVRDSSTNQFIITDITAATTNTVTLTFATPPSSGQYRSTVIG